MYSLLLYSLIISSIIFGVLQYIDKSNKEKAGEIWEMQKHLLTTGNAILFFMLFLTCMVLLYFILSDNNDFLTSLGIFEEETPGTNKRINIKEPMYDVKRNSSIDPTMLKRIHDPLKYGFEPYSGGSDMSSSECSSSGSGSSVSSDSSSEGSSNE